MATAGVLDADQDWSSASEDDQPDDAAPPANDTAQLDDQPNDTAQPFDTLEQAKAGSAAAVDTRGESLVPEQDFSELSDLLSDADDDGPAAPTDAGQINHTTESAETVKRRVASKLLWLRRRKELVDRALGKLDKCIPEAVTASATCQTDLRQRFESAREATARLEEESVAQVTGQLRVRASEAVREAGTE